jgi:hypothetical protein
MTSCTNTGQQLPLPLPARPLHGDALLLWAVRVHHTPVRRHQLSLCASSGEDV